MSICFCSYRPSIIPPEHAAMWNNRPQHRSWNIRIFVGTAYPVLRVRSLPLGPSLVEKVGGDFTLQGFVLNRDFYHIGVIWVRSEPPIIARSKASFCSSVILSAPHLSRFIGLGGRLPAAAPCRVLLRPCFESASLLLSAALYFTGRRSGRTLIPSGFPLSM